MDRREPPNAKWTAPAKTPGPSPNVFTFTLVWAGLCVEAMPDEGLTEIQLPTKLEAAARNATGTLLLVDKLTCLSWGEAPPATATKKSPDGDGAGTGGVFASLTLSTAVRSCGEWSARGSFTRSSA